MATLSPTSVFAGLGQTEAYSFKISGETKSFLVQGTQEQGAGGQQKLFISELIAPNGRRLIQSDFRLASQIGLPANLLTEVSSPIRSTAASPYQIAVIIDQENAEGPIEGFWSVRFASSSTFLPVRLKVTESIQRKSKPLKFHIFFDSNRSRLSHSEVLNLTKSVSDFYKRYQLNISFEVQNLRLPPKDDMDSQTWLNTSSGLPQQPRSIFLFDSKTIEDSTAYSNCLPGFESEGGISRCPITASFIYSFASSRKKYSKILAHEIGHYLGLFHPCDDLGFSKVCDSLQDTTDQPSSLNLMNTGSETDAHYNLSEEQVQKIKGNPLLYENTQILQFEIEGPH